MIIGDPFSRYVQLLLTLFAPRHLTVVDDGTATMEFAAQLGRGERLVRWHRKGSMGPRELVLAPVTSLARRKLAPPGAVRSRSSPRCPWRPRRASRSPRTRTPGPGTASARRCSPAVRTWSAPPWWRRAVVDADHYARVVQELARAHGATRYFAHRRRAPRNCTGSRSRPASRWSGPICPWS
ncbi:hypothetical protein STANM309S_05013 [Streptomyces tanashiensis]